MKIEVVPRFRIDGKYYTMDQLPEERVREIVTEKLDLAMAALKYERKRAAKEGGKKGGTSPCTTPQ